MKNFFFYFFALFFCASCATTKPTVVAPPQQPTEQFLLLTPDLFFALPAGQRTGVQVFSGGDTLRFIPEVAQTSVVGSEGKVIFQNQPPLVVLPHTPGVITNIDTSKKILTVSFWTTGEVLFFGPDMNADSTRVFGVYSFGDKPNNYVYFGGKKFFPQGTESNFLLFLPEYKGEGPKVAPGRRVGVSAPPRQTTYPTPSKN